MNRKLRKSHLTKLYHFKGHPLKPIYELPTEDLNSLLFYTSPKGEMIPISSIISISPTTLKTTNATFTINDSAYNNLKDKLTNYEAIKLMYSQTPEYILATKEALKAQLNGYLEPDEADIDDKADDEPELPEQLQQLVAFLSALNSKGH